MLAPRGVFTELNATVGLGAFLASIMPISLFFATETTVKLAVAPVYGSVAQRRRRAATKLVLIGEKDHPMDQRSTSNGPANGPLGGPGMDHQKDHSWTTQQDHPRTAQTKRAEVDPQAIRELAEKDKLSQRAAIHRGRRPGGKRFRPAV
ncbi:hypothetical protein ACLH0K_08850 [Arthrobacter sp. MPF02]|uniref:hypothetical protein n=1 Tax=Arthrobacter sp. MPF02 TaxID=3388492 RepID=UPI00398506B5